MNVFAEAKTPLPAGPGKQVAVFVALCDNEHQGIAPVPDKIGKGDDPAHNLYWGCSDALPKVMRASADWGRPVYHADYLQKKSAVLDTVVCTRADKAATVYAYAYRGDAIAACMQDFEEAVASGAYDLVAFIGHNGLMDVDLPEREPARGNTDAVVLCCMSDEWFSDRIRALGGRPVLMTQQLMYPAGKVFTEALRHGSRRREMPLPYAGLPPRPTPPIRVSVSRLLRVFLLLLLPHKNPHRLC